MISSKVVKLIIKKFTHEHENLLHEVKRIAMTLNKRTDMYNKIVNYEMNYYNNVNNGLGDTPVMIMKNGMKFLDRLSDMIKKEEESIEYLKNDMQEYSRQLHMVKKRIEMLEDLLLKVVKQEDYIKLQVRDRQNQELYLLKEIKKIYG